VLADRAGSPQSAEEITVAVARLEAGMVVARDVHSPHGALLLREGAMLDAPTINTLSRLVWSSGIDVQIPVRVA
jgi:hypothetical protein